MIVLPFKCFSFFLFLHMLQIKYLIDITITNKKQFTIKVKKIKKVNCFIKNIIYINLIRVKTKIIKQLPRFVQNVQ